ncbi:MAG: T9SS type A sorting domain-containing protein [Flavobacteriales bacterium]|nr:T9SS type A sorting domain-containing protein [Flavobacteriales bacterium]
MDQKKTLAALLLLAGTTGLHGQTTLFQENFEGTYAFTLNTTDVGCITTSTTNKWVVNNVYTGGLFGLIPNTAAQPAGIVPANGNYLHTLSNTAQTFGVLNSNFMAPGDGPTFARMSADVSTIGLVDINLSFWWVCQGGPTNFGEVYYSTNAGSTWTLINTGSPASGQYRNQTAWVQQNISLPAFEGQATLRFGFRFVNSGSTGSPSSPGFSIDDVRVIGTAAGPTCTEDLFFVHNNTTNYQDLVWTIHDQTDDSVVETGGINPGEGSVPLCLPDGCFYLRVTNSGGNVISGGYRLVLKDAVGAYGNARIIDDTDNLVLGPGGGSGISNNEGFCIPLGTDEPIYTSCDRYWWSSGDYLVGKENAAVSAEFGGPNASSSGYEFWFYDPNGGLSFRKTRVHTVSDGFAPNNAVRACHIKLNNWAAASHLQNGVLYNVRSRGVVAGNPLSEFGPACRVTLDPVLAACPPTGLNDIPGNPNYSCGVTKKFGGPNQVANRLYCRPVAGANLYEWEFTNDPNEPAYYVTRQTTGVQRHLNWPASQGDPMLVGNTYRVRVRASKDGGANWCDWGWTCEVTIIPSAAPGNENMAPEGEAASNLALWPNPNNGQQVWITLPSAGVPHEARSMTVDIHDLGGDRIMAREMAIGQGVLSIDLEHLLAPGVYMVIATVGEDRHVRRLVVAH